jgi:hypothetical protein
MSFSSVHAQTMSITNLLFPSSALAGSLEPLPVSVSVPYNDAKAGYWLLIGIVDPQLNRAIVPGSVSGSPSSCVNQPVAQALCRAQLQSTSGIEYLQFRIGGIFADTQRAPGTWNLQMTAEMLDSNSTVLTRSDVSFAINLTPVTLTIDVPNNATVWVDGAAKTGGNIPVGLGRHSISVPMFVTINDTERLSFDSWSDGVSQPNRTVFVSSDMELKVVYHIQHRLSINSNVAGVSVTGEGWYADGSIATFSVPMTQLSTGGVLDLLGAKVTFQGWFEGGNLITTSSSGTIEMNSAHTIRAQWVTDYTMPIILFAAVVIVVGLGVYFVTKRSSRKTKRSARKIGMKRPRRSSKKK